MELTPYPEGLPADVAAVAAPGGPATARAAARIPPVGPVSPAGPLTSVGPLPAEDDGDLARLTVRLPEALRTHVEQIAAVEGISVNTWLVRAVAVAVNQQHGPPPAAHGAWAGVTAV